MAQEIEAKYKVDSFSPVRRALKRLGAQRLFWTVQRDEYFDTPRRSLLSSDQGVRLRLIRQVRPDKAAPDSQFQLTYKGPRRAGAVKSRVEHQMRLEDPQAMADLLGALGLLACLVVEKRRTSYRLGRCIVELDELPVIGRFVEIEGPSAFQVTRLAARLDLPGEPIADPYIDLLRRRCPSAGGECAEITFKRCGRTGRCRRRARRGRPGPGSP